MKIPFSKKIIPTTVQLLVQSSAKLFYLIINIITKTIPIRNVTLILKNFQKR